jgi:GTPase SAR1 family protein
MFSVDDKSSFSSAKKYYDELKNKYPTSLIVVCGTKQDCVNRQVTKTNAKKFADRNTIQYFDTSAKTCYKIEEPFLYIIKRLLMNDTVKFKSYDISAEHDE